MEATKGSKQMFASFFLLIKYNELVFTEQNFDQILIAFLLQLKLIENLILIFNQYSLNNLLIIGLFTSFSKSFSSIFSVLRLMRSYRTFRSHFKPICRVLDSLTRWELLLSECRNDDQGLPVVW